MAGAGPSAHALTLCVSSLRFLSCAFRLLFEAFHFPMAGAGPSDFRRTTLISDEFPGHAVRVCRSCTASHQRCVSSLPSDPLPLTLPLRPYTNCQHSSCMLPPFLLVLRHTWTIITARLLPCLTIYLATYMPLTTRLLSLCSNYPLPFVRTMASWKRGPQSAHLSVESAVDGAVPSWQPRYSAPGGHSDGDPMVQIAIGGRRPGAARHGGGEAGGNKLNIVRALRHFKDPVKDAYQL